MDRHHLVGRVPRQRRDGFEIRTVIAAVNHWNLHRARLRRGRGRRLREEFRGGAFQAAWRIARGSKSIRIEA